jgi:hypothetical protein
MLLTSAEWVDAVKNAMSPDSVLPSGTDMEWNEVFAIGSSKLVNLESLAGYCAILLTTWEGGIEERQALAAEVAHCDARDWHDNHESIEGIVANFGTHCLDCPRTWGNMSLLLGQKTNSAVTNLEVRLVIST